MISRYTKVKELMAANTEGERILTAENGINYMITAETRLLPYLTRNIVSRKTLQKEPRSRSGNEGEREIKVGKRRRVPG